MTLKDRADEIVAFKKDINLAEYASKFGYKLDKQRSSRNSYVMKHDNGDKIVVTTALDGHGIYFNVYNSNDNGTIIDFHQKRTGDTLGITRKTLRQELGLTENRVKLAPLKKPRKSSNNLRKIIKSLAEMTNACSHPYLINERCIPSCILEDPRFETAVKRDRWSNVVFPHYDENGLSGYELKNKKFTGFSCGGTKSLWHSTNLKEANEIVITESGIDALSHATLKPSREVAYISVGGSPSNKQKTS